MLGKLSSYLLIVASLLLVLQEEFLIEKIPFTFFYTCKLIFKTLVVRSLYGEGRTLNDFTLLFFVCFGKKLVFDIAYYQIHWEKYFKYIGILICIDYVLLLLEKKGHKPKSFLNIEPLKTFLTLASGISDSIGLENLLWKNQLNYLHLPVVFLFVVLDPVLYCLTTWKLKGEKKENNYKAFKKSLKFGVLLTAGHFICSFNKYATLIGLRRKIPFNSSNVMSFSVGIRLLNCFSYIILSFVELIGTGNIGPGSILIKDNYVKVKDFPKVVDVPTAVSSITSIEEDYKSL